MEVVVFHSSPEPGTEQRSLSPPEQWQIITNADELPLA